jgi:hypothetical protein
VFKTGKTANIIKTSDWNMEVKNIRKKLVPDPQQLEKLHTVLLGFSRKFIAPDHRPCFRLK